MPAVDPDYGLGFVPVPLSLGPTNLGVLSDDPDTGSSNQGDFFYLSTTGRVRMFNGTSWQDLSVYTNAARTNAANDFVSGQRILIGSDSNRGLDIRRNSATQTGELFRLLDSNGTTVLAQFNANGAQTVSPASGTAVTVNAAASAIGLVVKLGASGSSDLQQWQSNGGAVLASVNSLGGIYSTSASVFDSSLRVGAATDYSATINAQPLNTSFSAMVLRGRASQTAELSRWEDSTGARLASIDASGRLIIGSASLYSSATMSVRSTVTTAVVSVIRGAASQTGDLQQWQNSSGTALAYMTSAGVFRADIVQSNSANFDARTLSAGGVVTLLRATSAATNPGANYARLYFRDGTNAGTLKLVVRAGAAGAETTVLDNIPT